MHSEVEAHTTYYTDVDFEKLLLIRFFHDIMIRLDVPRPRISKLYTYWTPV